MIQPTRRIAWPPTDTADPEAPVTREWLVANGLGGYASGTVSGVITRRYHGVLISALAAPLGRIVMLSTVAEQLKLPNGKEAEIGGRERSGDAPDAHGTGYLTEFRLEAGLPVWRYDVEGVVIEKRIFLLHMQNTVHVMYELVSGADRVELALRPSVNFRAQEQPVSEPLAAGYEFHAIRDFYEICLPTSPVPPLRFKLWADDVTFILKGRRLDNVLYPVEESRGYQARGDLWSPGYFRFAVSKTRRATLVASTESPDTMQVLAPERALDAERGRRRRLVTHATPEAHDGVPAEL